MHQLEKLRKFLRDQMNSHADALATGAAQSFDEYKRMVGIIHGLAMSERHLLDLIEEEGKNDE